MMGPTDGRKKWKMNDTPIDNQVPTAIDFIDMYARRIDNEPEFDQVDDMLKAAAVLAVRADEILDGSLPEGEE